MKKMLRLVGVAITSSLFWGVLTSTNIVAQNIYLNASPLRSKTTTYWVACGGDKVRIIDVNKSDSSHAEIIWEWNQNNTKSEVPSNYVSLFKTMDECKPIENNTKILACSSAGGAMIIDINGHKCEYYCRAPQAHSIEMLPNNRIVVAESITDLGNALEVFDITKKTGSAIIRDSMYSAHGVVWYEETQRLYAIGKNLFRIYKLTDWDTNKPSLTLETELKLPVSGAHDLTRIDNHRLLISCTAGVYDYDINTKTISKFDPLVDYTDLKSVNYNYKTGQIVYTKPEESWWTYHLSSLNPTFGIGMSDVNVYKVRVFQE